MVKASPGTRWVWLMLDIVKGQDQIFRWSQEVKHKNLTGQYPPAAWVRG